MKSLILMAALVCLQLNLFARKANVMETVEDPGPRVVRYDLYVSDTVVRYTGKPRKAIAVNGSIPAPTLYFTEGDTAEIYVHNKLGEATSVHWHGLLLPNQYDGVPFLTTRPVPPGATHLYRFPIRQSGTYWYHSHAGFQEQSGLYGAFIIRKREVRPMKELTVLLSDWTDENPAQVHRRLHNATDWYAIRKGSTQSYAEAVRSGYFKTKFTNEWKRMQAMDVSDVYYDRFLLNGRTEMEVPQLRAGDQVKLRIINGSSSSYFWLQFAGSKMEVVASDGMDVAPVQVDRMIIGVSETYDVVVTIPDDKSYEFLATSEDRTGSVSLFLGAGNRMKELPLQRLQYFEGMKMMNGMMKMDGSMNDMGMQMSNQQMDMNQVMYPEMSAKSSMHGMDSTMMHEQDMASFNPVTLNYSMLRAPAPTTLPEGPVKEFHFELSGNMNRYVWTINNKTVSESDRILIRKGENVRIIMRNNTMMRHPMHLHGHFFRLLNGQGANAPLKNVVDIMPMETDTLEFAATESGDWFFHCHILYHMMSGMGRVFSYQDGILNPEVPDPVHGYKMVQRDDRRLHLMGRAGLETNGSDGELMLSNTRYRLQTEWRIGLSQRHGYESESHLGRYIGKMQWLMPYVGWDFRYRKMDMPERTLFGQYNTKDKRTAFCVGLQYTLPLLVIADFRVDTDGKLRLQLAREDIPVSSRLRFAFMVNTDREYMAGFRYVMTKTFSFSAHYDSDMGIGGGITLNY